MYKTFLRKATSLFIAMMVFFTFFSQTINNLNTPRIRTVKPREGALIQTIRGEGQIVPETCTRLYFPVTLIIDRFLVHPGDHIQKGTELFLLNSSLIEEEYEEEFLQYYKIQLELEQIKEEWQNREEPLYNTEELEKQLQLAREDKNIKMMMYNSGSIAKRALDEADITLEQKQFEYIQALKAEETDRKNEAIRIKNLERQISATELELDVLRQNVDVLSALKEYPVFLSPLEGEILTINCQEGMRIPREDPVLSVLNSTDRYIFEATIDSDEIHDLSPGDYASIYLNEEKEMESRLESLYSPAGVSSATLQFSLPQEDLRGNERGSFLLRKKSGFYPFILPKRSIRGVGREQFIYLAEEKQGALSHSIILKKVRIEVLESRHVSVAVSGNIAPDSLVVLDEDRTPLKEGDRVLIE